MTKRICSRGAALAALAGSALALTARQASAQIDISWAATNSGNWGTASNWSPQTVPNNNGPNTYNAHINVSGSSYIVTADANFTVSNFEMLSPDAMLDLGTTTLRVLGNYTHTGATLRGQRPLAGSVTVGGTTTFSNAILIGVQDFRSNGNLVFNGTIADEMCDTDVHHNGGSCLWQGTGDILMDNGATFTNGAASTFGIQNDRTLVWEGGGTRPVFTNLGTLNKTTGAGQTFFDGVTLNNTGTLQVSTGTLKSNGVALGGDNHTLTGGTWRVQTGGALVLVDSGDVAQTINTNNATVVVDGAASSFAAIDSIQTNGVTGRFTVQNGHNFTTAGNFNNQGQLTVGSATAFQATSLDNVTGTTLTGGTYNVLGTFAATNAPSIQTLAANVTLDGLGSTFVALNQLQTIAAAGALTTKNSRNFTTTGNFTNSGALRVETGTAFRVNPGSSLLNVTGGTLTGGTYNLQGTLQADNANISTLSANVTLDGTGNHLLNAGGANGFFAGASNTISPSGALTIKNNSNYVINGDLNVSPGTTTGSLTVDAASTVRVNGNMSNFVGGILHDGTLTIDGFLRADNANITRIANTTILRGPGDHIINNITGLSAFAGLNRIETGGSFSLLNGATQTFQTSLTMQTTSTFVVSNAPGLRQPQAVITEDFIQEGGDFSAFSTEVAVNQNWMQHAGTGLIDASNVTITHDLTQDPAGSITLANGGTLTVGGTFTMNGGLYGSGSTGGGVTSNGTIAPGVGTLGLGILSFDDDLTLNAGSILEIQVGGLDPLIPEFDQVHVTGALGIGGTFRVALVGGFSPSMGDQFDVLTWGSLSNPGADFAAYEGLDIPGGMRFHVDRLDGVLRLTVVPAPGATLPLALGGLVALRRRRR